MRVNASMDTARAASPPVPPKSQKRSVARLAAAHLSTGLVAGILATGLFAWLWDQVEDKDPGATWLDHAVSAALHGSQAPALTSVAVALAHLGGPVVMITVAALAALAGLVFPRLRAMAWSVPLAVAGAGALVECAKLVFERPRPTFFEPLIAARGYSFPSGHSLVAMVLYGLLGYLICTTVRSKPARAAVAVVAALLIVSIGLSRIYVGVHYPTDVLAGWTAGVPWLIACIRLHKAMAHRWPAAVDATQRSAIP